MEKRKGFQLRPGVAADAVTCVPCDANVKPTDAQLGALWRHNNKPAPSQQQQTKAIHASAAPSNDGGILSIAQKLNQVAFLFALLGLVYAVSDRIWAYLLS